MVMGDRGLAIPVYDAYSLGLAVNPRKAVEPGEEGDVGLDDVRRECVVVRDGEAKRVEDLLLGCTFGVLDVGVCGSGKYGSV